MFQRKPDATFEDTAPKDRIEFLKQKYGEQIKRKSGRGPNNTEADDFDLLIAADPTSGPGRAGNYSEWIIKQYIADTTGRFIEDLGKMTDDLAIFDRFKSRIPMEPAAPGEKKKNPRDINSHTALSLYQTVQAIRAQKEKDGGTKTKAEVVNTEQKLLYKDESVIAIQPLTHRASVIHGRGTRWCTAADSDYGKQHFTSYTSNGKFLVIFKYADGFAAQLEVDEKSATSQRLMNTTQLMDTMDQTIDIVELLKHYNGKHQEDFIAWLAGFTNIRHHAALARQDATKADVAKKFTTQVANEPMSTKLALAQATNLSDEELQQLRQGNNSDVEAKILRYQKVSDEEFSTALQSKNNAIRLGAASNPYLPHSLMQQIVQSTDSFAKTGLACNRSLPPDIKAKLPADVIEFSKTVDKNVEDSRKVLHQIAQAIQMTPEEIATLRGGDIDPALQRRLLRFQKVPEEDYEAAITSGNIAVRLAACRNPNLPKELMMKVASDTREETRACRVGLANNPNLTPEAEKLLAKDEKIRPVLARRKKK